MYTRSVSKNGTFIDRIGSHLLRAENRNLGAVFKRDRNTSRLGKLWPVIVCVFGVHL